MNERRRLLAEEYMIDLDATQAAIRAGYAPRSAKNAMGRAMKDPAFRALLEDLMASRRRQNIATADRVLEELTRMGTANIVDLFDGEGVPIPPHELPREVAAAVEDVAVESKGGEFSYRYKFGSKKAALDLLGKYHKLWTERIALGGDDQSGPVQVVVQEQFVEAPKR